MLSLAIRQPIDKSISITKPINVPGKDSKNKVLSETLHMKGSTSNIPDSSTIRIKIRASPFVPILSDQSPITSDI